MRKGLRGEPTISVIGLFCVCSHIHNGFTCATFSIEGIIVDGLKWFSSLCRLHAVQVVAV